MAKKPTQKLILPVHDERCGNCYYNEEGVCNKDPKKCPYNQPPKINEEEEEDE